MSMTPTPPQAGERAEALTTELVELADCPFCGGKPDLYDTTLLPQIPKWRISCANRGCPADEIWVCKSMREEAITAWNTRALASRAGGLDDDGPVFSGRKIRFDHLAEKLLPVALGGFNCAGPHDWRMKEAIRAVLCELYPLPPALDSGGAGEVG